MPPRPAARPVDPRALDRMLEFRVGEDGTELEFVARYAPPEIRSFIAARNASGIDLRYFDYTAPGNTLKKGFRYPQ